MKKKLLKKTIKKKIKFIIVRLSLEEKTKIKENALKYYRNGEMSGWMRHSAMHHKPSPEELISLK